MEKYKARALIVVFMKISIVKGFDITDHRDVGDLRNPVRTDSGGLGCLGSLNFLIIYFPKLNQWT